jgi:hypothetical protein
MIRNTRNRMRNNVARNLAIANDALSQIQERVRRALTRIAIGEGVEAWLDEGDEAARVQRALLVAESLLTALLVAVPLGK